MRPPPADPASCAAARLLRRGSSSCTATRTPQPFHHSHLASPSPPPPSRHHSTRVDASVSCAAEASPRLFRASFVACIRCCCQRNLNARSVPASAPQPGGSLRSLLRASFTQVTPELQLQRRGRWTQRLLGRGGGGGGGRRAAACSLATHARPRRHKATQRSQRPRVYTSPPARQKAACHGGGWAAAASRTGKLSDNSKPLPLFAGY